VVTATKQRHAASAGRHAVVRAVVVDDHALVRDAVKLALNDDPRIEVVGEARSGAEALSTVRLTDPDVVVLDFRLPDFDAPSLIQELRARGSRAEVLVLSGYCERRNVRMAVDSGARGFLTKQATDMRHLADAIVDVSQGKDALSQDALSALLKSVREHTAALESGLTPREREIWLVVAQGKGNAAIAKELFISERTVKYHVSNLLAKTGAESRAELVSLAFRIGLMDSVS
jgi:DNA-binding NarL/FixJ family response regulator